MSGAAGAARTGVLRLLPRSLRRPRAGRAAGALATLRRSRNRVFGVRYGTAVPPRPATAYILFAITPLLYVAQQLSTHASSILGGEMYAEMSSNYYAVTQTYGARLQLLAVDAGYIPLPQRIIGLVGWWLGLSPSTIPYYYTGTALVASGLLVGAICLPVFRGVIANDGLRFALAAAVLLLVDTESRLYINFTYLVVVPAAFLGALALVGREVPRWAWLLPILLISKPAVLTVVPLIVVAALVSTRRFRLIAAASLLATAVQVVRLAISSTLPGSLLQQGPAAPLPEKVLVAVQYTLGFLGRFVSAPTGGLTTSTSMLIGALVLVGFAVVAVLARSRAGAIVIAGLGLVAADMLLNATVYSNWFNADLSMTMMMGFDRRVVVALLGTLIAAAGVAAALSEAAPVKYVAIRLARALGGRGRTAIMPVLRAAGLLVFIGWLGIAGWVKYSVSNNAPIFAPFADVSEWQTMAPALAAGQPVVCIPTAPFGWSAYGRNCATLSASIPSSLNYQPIKEQANGTWTTNLPVPPIVRDRTLAAVAILVLPTHVERQVSATLTVTTASGDKRVFRAAKHLPLTGGALLFENSPADLLQNPRSISIVFDAPVKVGWAISPDGTGPAIVAHWMGQ